MRLHIQNREDTQLPFIYEEWQAASREFPEVASQFELSISSKDRELEQFLPDVEVLLTWTEIIKSRFLSGEMRRIAPKLKALYCNAAGIDRITPLSWLPDDVLLMNNSGVQYKKAGEFCLMALLMLHNRLPEIVASNASQIWHQYYGSSLSGRTVGVVGTGSIGGEVARLAKQFGMRVIGVRSGKVPHPHCDEVVAFLDIETILPKLDSLVLACPLTDQTVNLLSRDRIALLPRGARVINVARGAVWDQDAVCDALESGALSAALTDVPVPEPLAPGDRAWSTKNLIVTPHIAADDHEHYNLNTLMLFLKNMDAYLRGDRPPNHIDPSKGY